jgi:AcrR family transcriptional regulator
MSAPVSRIAPGRRERAGDRTRARLLAAAVEEFHRVGFDRANIARIASRARVSRPSFYFHFPTKDHVLLELQWGLERGVVERIAVAPTLRRALGTFVDAMLDAEEQLGGSGLLRDILNLYVRRPPGIDLDDQPLPLVHELGSRFASAAAQRELRPDLDPERATQLCLTSIFGYLSATEGTREERRADLEVLVSLFLAPEPAPGAPEARRAGDAGRRPGGGAHGERPA